MSLYTVSKLAKIAHVSIRSLHYYDQIGLLKPSSRSEAGYRLYDHADLMRLQQIMFFRELDLPLKEIRRILDADDFDPLATLQDHRSGLRAQRRRLSRLIETLDQTIAQLKEDGMMLSDEELFAAFTPEQAERYRREARALWGEERVEETEHRIRKLSREEWRLVQEEGEQLTQALAALIDREVEDDEVQQAIARHHAWIENFYPAPAAVYLGLAQMYTEHPEFRAYYERFEEGFADFMQKAMQAYTKKHLG